LGVSSGKRKGRAGGGGDDAGRGSKERREIKEKGVSPLPE